MSYNIGEIFTLDDEYTERENFCNENGYYIKEIEPLEDGTRQFTIKEPYKINDVFTLDEEYTERAEWCNENGYYIEEIEPLEDGTRQFTIKEPAKPSLEEIKTQKLAKLSSLSSEFEKTENKEMVVNSSLGFRINADPKAKRNIDTLIELEVSTFRDYDNEIHLDMTTDDLNIIKREISINAVNLYNQKWKMETEINSLESVEEVENYQIVFEMLDFSNEN